MGGHLQRLASARGLYRVVRGRRVVVDPVT